MFILIEMDGFGYPMFDWLKVVINKGKNMYESTQKMMTLENIEKEISENQYNKNGLSRLELEQSYEKKEMDIEGNYSDILAIYWITMFYLSIYPIGIIQSFLNLLFIFIIERNFLLNVYKRPDYINPQFGFLCFNFFNFGFSLFLCGDIIFFKNEDNKKSFGVVYIVIMIIILIIPIYYLAKFIMYLTNYCCIKKKESENLNNVRQRIKSDYRLFNPCYQKEKIKQILKEYQRKNLLTKTQYKELIDKLNKLNDLDLYKLQQNMRIPKLMTFEERKIASGNKYENNSIPIKNEEKEKLYYLLMQLGFISYLEEGNVLKPKKKTIKYDSIINSISLNSLSMQENLSNSDSGYFTIFNENNELIMPYVDNERNVKIFDVFNRKVLNDVKDLNHTKKIVCVDYFIINERKYLISIALDNTMIISDLTINEKGTNKIIKDIGTTFKDNQPNNTFSLSTIRHEGDIWIITSYYYDQYFKIFNINGDFIKGETINEYIISLEALYFTEENTYICVRSPNSINLFINQFFIKQIIYQEDAHINFKIIKPLDLILETNFIIITIINKDLSSYTLHIINISNIFPLYTRLFNATIKFIFGYSINNEVHIPMNENIRAKIIDRISKNPLSHLGDLGPFPIMSDVYNDQIEERLKFFESDDNDKFNIGNILFWGNGYIIVGTPFNYLDVIDFFKAKQKVGVINNEEMNYSDTSAGKINNIISYNISEKIYDPEFGYTFIKRDNKGKIQYIRPKRILDKLNYKIIKSDEYFNDLEDDEKLEHILFSTKFYLIYLLASYLAPLIAAIYGHLNHNDSLDNSIYIEFFPIYVLYAILGIWFKGCVYDIKDESHTKRTCTIITIYACLFFKFIANIIFAYRYCRGNKTGIIFVSMLFGIYLIHLILNCIIYICKIKFLLRTYWLGFLFYQISRLCILIFFIVSILLNVNHVEAYIYAGIFCIILIYMYMANYFNTLMKDIMYNNYFQAVFNYPFEWMNLFCCWKKNPKECIREIDIRFCCCDSFFLALAQILFYIAIFYILLMILAIYCILSMLGCDLKRRNENN